MIYTVAIGDTLIKVSSISRVEVLDETLDYASIVIPKDLVLDTKMMKEVVTITVDDNSEIISYYFLIDSDIATPVDKDNTLLSRHEISLVELTSRMNDYTVGYRKFTNNTDTLYDVLRDLTDTIFWRNPLISDPSRLLDVDLSHSSLDPLKDILSRDFQFDNNTYREAVDFIFNEFGGIPRIIFENGIFKLTLDKLNERKSLRVILENNENNYKQTHNINKYATAIESYIDNQIFDKTLEGAAIAEPSSESFMVVTTETAVFNSSNSIFKTKYPIREIVKAEMFFNNVDATTLTFDMTPRLIPEELYKGLPPGDITLEALGNTTDGLLARNITPAPTLINGRLQVSQQIGTLYYKDNVIQNLYTVFDTVVWGDENMKYIINSIYFEEYGNAIGSSAVLKYVEANNQFENLRIRITYVPIFDSALQVERYNTDDIDKFTMMQTNQSASAVSTEKALKQMGTLINSLGNKEIMTTKRIKLIADEFEIGDYTSDNYILTKKEVLYYPDHFDVRYEWDKDYQKRNQDVEVDSALRHFAIPQSGVSERKLTYKEYAYIGFDNLTSETTLLGFDGREIFTNVIEKSATYNTSIQNALVTNEEVLTTTTPLLLPVISSGGYNVLNFNFGFQSPNIAGTQLDTVTQTIPTLNPIEYVDNDGEAEFINWELVDKVTVTDSKTLPLTPRTDRNATLVGSIFDKYLVKKDSAESLDMAYQLHLIPNNNIVIGDYFTSRNNLIETKSAFEDLVVYSSTEFYTPSEGKRVKGTLAVGVTVSRLSNEIITISANVNNAAWAIATTSGELVFAVNQFTALQDRINIQYFNSRFDINYDFLGATLHTPPASPTNLVVTTFNAGTLDLAWTDNSANESNFLIEISEDDITYSFLDTVQEDITTYRASSLMAGTLYYFKVYSYNQAGTNGVSADGSGTTDAAPNPPATPTDYIVTAQDGDKLNASWTLSPTADTYTLEIKRNDGSTWTTANVNDPTATYQWTGLTSSTLYDTRIKANNADGSSGYQTYSVFTGNPPAPQTATPSFDTIYVDENSVTFRVFNNDSSTATIITDWALGTNGDSTPDRTTITGVVTVTGNISYALEAGTTYTISASAQASGETVSATIFNTFTTDAASTPPDAPTTFTGTNASGGINFTWNNVTDETGYTIEIHTNSSFSALLDTINKAADTTTHSESPMFAGTYWARIKASNAVGDSAWKNNTDNPITVA